MKADVYLFRNPSTKLGTFGLWTIPKHNKILYSLERSWENNKINISCIPTGIYRVVWNYSHTFKKYMYQILDVDGRTGIRVHSANRWHELKGCVALGYGINLIGKDHYITASQNAVVDFQNLMKRESFTLSILWSDYIL